MERITFAIVPSLSRGEADREAVAHLSGFLTEQLRRPVEGVTAPSYESVVSELERERVQFAWMPPVLMVLAEERVKVRPLLSAVRGDLAQYRGVLFVDGACTFTTVEELQGQRIAWVDPSSAAGYLYPRLHLLVRGLDPARHFREELYAGSHGDVVRAVFDGRAEVGATFAVRPAPGRPIERAAFVDVDPARTVRVLEWTKPIPNDLVVGHGHLPVELHRAFAEALLRLGTFAVGRTLLHNVFQAEKFVLASRNPLKPLRELVDLARRHGVLAQL